MEGFVDRKEIDQHLKICKFIIYNFLSQLCPLALEPDPLLSLRSASDMQFNKDKSSIKQCRIKKRQREE